MTVAEVALRPGGLRPAVRERRLPDGWADRLSRVLLAELLGLLAAVGPRLATGHPGLRPAAACLVVGAHFLPLAQVFDQWQYRWTGLALLATAAIGLALVASGHSDAGVAVVGFGAALILIATAAHLISRPQSE